MGNDMAHDQQDLQMGRGVGEEKKRKKPLKKKKK
jgi:hypothetical protein